MNSLVDIKQGKFSEIDAVQKKKIKAEKLKVSTKYLLKSVKQESLRCISSIMQ